MDSFWQQLAKPIFVLAPMANVTDAAFRRMFATYGKPDVLYTEFVSVAGLLSPGKDRLLVDFWFSKAERPIVAQIFGSKPVQFTDVAALIQNLGFDGIDLNMGCPDRAVMKQGAGAALIQEPERAVEIIRATKRGAPGLPISVKTRIGDRTNEIHNWFPHLLGEDLAAVTIHLRTRTEMSDVSAHWELAPAIVTLRDKLSPTTKILGNGDVETLAEGRRKVRETGMDGMMIGRGAFGKPWFFSEKMPTVAEHLRQLVEHTELFDELYIRGPESQGQKRSKPFEIMKRHFKAYTAGIIGAKELREQLMATNSTGAVKKVVEHYLA